MFFVCDDPLPKLYKNDDSAFTEVIPETLNHCLFQSTMSALCSKLPLKLSSWLVGVVPVGGALVHGGGTSAGPASPDRLPIKSSAHKNKQKEPPNEC